MESYIYDFIYDFSERGKDPIDISFSYPTATVIENQRKPYEKPRNAYFLYDKNLGLDLDEENTENIMIGRNPDTIGIFNSINNSLSNTVNIPLFLAYFNLTPYDVYDIGYKYENYTSSST
jgi:hypothetical protein